jgi:hypothetical protein
MFHRDSASVDPLVRQGSATRAGQQLSPCFNLIPVRMFSERRNGGGEALALMLALSIRRLAPRAAAHMEGRTRHSGPCRSAHPDPVSLTAV